MGKLIKYELRKNLGMLIAMLSTIGAVEIYFLLSLAADKESHVVVSAFLMPIGCFLIALLVFILGVTSYSRELSQKSSYLLFMTPHSTLSIISSKVLYTVVLGVGFAALLGGLRGSMAVDGRVLCAEYPVHPGFGFCALIPNFETSTRDARRVLPGQVPFSDATANLARLALTLRALETGDAEMLGAAMDDRLHQPYRKQLIHEYDRVRALALANGAAAFCISGSGSTLLSVVRAEEAETFAERMESALADSLYGWRALALHPDFEGARILEK